MSRPEEETDPPTTSEGRRAPTVAAVHLDQRTLDAIIAGVTAQLCGDGGGEGVAPGTAGGPSVRDRPEGEHPVSRGIAEMPPGTRGE